MSGLSRVATRALATLTVALVASCAGRSERTSNDDDGGSGGSAGGSGNGGTSGASGSTSGGTSGTGGDGSCAYAGQVYEDGASFPAGDGCNTCFCMAGSVGCTLIGCPPDERCDALSSEYAPALERAKLCMVGDPNACSIYALSSLVCGCPTLVNDPYELGVIHQEAMDLNCGSNVICGACPTPPVSGSCGGDNACVDVFL